ncbi:hypothetical protein C8Q77DRAFT_1122747 [Trametes polyzona]|nr:hypothetical protein C8Q77DRAFT_1122747 [Trametes polyzona]
MAASPKASSARTAPHPPLPTTYTMRCLWAVPSTSSARPVRVVANAEQLVILRALYARVGEDATKEDVDEVSRETGLEAKWIRKWIKRQRAPRGKGKRSAPSKHAESPVSNGSVSTDATQTAVHSVYPMESISLDLSYTGANWHHLLPGQLGSSSDTGSSDGSPSRSEGSCSDNMTAQSVSPTPHTLTALPAPAVGPSSVNLGVPHPPVILPTRPVQVARPGSSFTVPLRFGLTSPDASGMPYPGTSRSLHVAPDGLLPIHLPGSDFFSMAQASHISVPAGRAQLLGLTRLDIPGGSHPASEPIPFSAPPAAFSLPGPLVPGGFTPVGEYFSRLFNDTDNDLTAIEPPPLHSTCYFGNIAGPSDMPPNLWAPSNVMPVSSEHAAGFSTPMPTPLSYQIRMSDLVALTKRLRESAAPGPHAAGQHLDSEAAASSPDMAGPTAHAQSPGTCYHTRVDNRSLTYRSGDAMSDVALSLESSAVIPELSMSVLSDDCVDNPGAIKDGEVTEDEDEVVTPCEEVDHFLSPVPATAATSLDKGKAVALPDLVEVADGTEEEL